MIRNFRRLLAIILGLALIPMYTASAETPQPGHVVSTNTINHAIGAVGHATGFRYISTRVDGQLAEVGGYTIEPSAAWQGDGPRPTVVVGPGTRGVADACAPSTSVGLIGNFDATTGALGTNYEQPFMYAFAASGIRVVVTDYIGLGGSDVHGYVIHTEEGRALLDAARAGLAVAGAAPDDPIGFWGYSQGGGAAAAAAEHADEYAPELNIKGTYAGAAPAKLPVVMEAVDGSLIAPVLGYAILGYSDRFEEFDAALQENLTPHGREVLAGMAESCIVDAAARWGGLKSETITTTGETFAQIAARDERISTLLEQESLGHRIPTTPIMLGTSTADDIIPASQVRTLHEEYCAAGANSTLHETSPMDLTFGKRLAVNHAAGLFLDAPASFRFLHDRFHDVPVTNNC